MRVFMYSDCMAASVWLSVAIRLPVPVPASVSSVCSVSFYLAVFDYLSVCMPVRPSVCLYMHLSARPSVCGIGKCIYVGLVVTHEGF